MPARCVGEAVDDVLAGVETCGHVEGSLSHSGSGDPVEPEAANLPVGGISGDDVPPSRVHDKPVRVHDPVAVSAVLVGVVQRHRLSGFGSLGEQQQERCSSDVHPGVVGVAGRRCGEVDRCEQRVQPPTQRLGQHPPQFRGCTVS